MTVTAIVMLSLSLTVVPGGDHCKEEKEAPHFRSALVCTVSEASLEISQMLLPVNADNRIIRRKREKERKRVNEQRSEAINNNEIVAAFFGIFFLPHPAGEEKRSKGHTKG